MQKYDRFGADVQQSYLLFATLITNTYLNLQAGAKPGPAAGTRMRIEGLTQVSLLLTGLIGAMNEYLSARGVLTMIDPMRDPLVASVRAIATKNVNDLIVKLMGGGLRTADLFTRDAGAIGQLLQERIARPAFTARDTAGRSWVAEKLVQTMARDWSYQGYIEDTIDFFHYKYVDTVTLVYPDDPDRSGPVALADIEARRAEIFHVNSSARLEAYVPS